MFVDPSDAYRITDNTRNIGLVVCRGTQLSFLSPVEGIEEIANPFTEEEIGEEEEEDLRVEA
jgi:U6 snRNA-associated Sm-like protein LSm7